MTRPLRVEFPGAIYHVTSRGNAGQKTFVDDCDREALLQIAHRAAERFNWVCHAYCLMSNHYHLVIETIDPTLSRGMRHVNGVYTQSFNRRHGRQGHLFQGRFKGILVERDSYLLELCRYVVLNPVRAGVAHRASDWTWSSYQATAGISQSADLLTIDWILSQFGMTRRQSMQAYRRFVAKGRDTSIWEALRGQIYLGGDAFVAGVAGRSGELQEIPRVQRLVDRPDLRAILRGRARQDPATIARAYHMHGYTMKEIAKHLGVHYATVSRRIRRYEDGADASA